MANFLKTAACPKCQSRGGDSKGNNRVIYDDNSYYCFSCGDFKTGTGSRSLTETEYSELPMYTTEAILGKRGISAEVIKNYGVKTLVDEDGQLSIKFPFHDVNRVESNCQYRAVDSATGELLHEIKFSKGKIKIPLFGWQLVKPQTKTLIICEGLTDALYFASNFSRSDTAVLGMSTATAAKKAAAHIQAYDNNYTIILAFDNDEAGNSAAERFADSFGEEKVLFRLSIPSEYNDVCEWSPNKEQLSEAITNAHPVSMLGILGAAEIVDRADKYLRALASDTHVKLSFAPKLTKATRFMPGKLIGIIGASGEGKSTLAEHLIMEFLQQSKKVFVVSQEMSPQEVAVKLLRMVRNLPLDDPDYVRTMTEEDFQQMRKDLRRLVDLMNSTDSYGQMSIETIEKHIYKLISIGRHPDLIVVDNLLAIAPTGEAECLKNICRDLKDLAEKHQTCIILISHTTKPPKKHRGVYQPPLNDAYGSSGMAISPDSVLGVVSDKEANVTYIHTAKLDRMGGKYANITYDYKDYCLIEQESGTRSNYNDEEDETYEDVY